MKYQFTIEEILEFADQETGINIISLMDMIKYALKKRTLEIDISTLLSVDRQRITITCVEVDGEVVGEDFAEFAIGLCGGEEKVAERALEESRPTWSKRDYI